MFVKVEGRRERLRRLEKELEKELEEERQLLAREVIRIREDRRQLEEIKRLSQVGGGEEAARGYEETQPGRWRRRGSYKV